MFAATSVAVILGSAGLATMMKICKNDEKKALMLIQLGIGVMVMLTAYMTSLPLALTFYLLHELLRGMFFPLK